MGKPIVSPEATSNGEMRRDESRSRGVPSDPEDLAGMALRALRVRAFGGRIKRDLSVSSDDASGKEESRFSKGGHGKTAQEGCAWMCFNRDSGFAICHEFS